MRFFDSLDDMKTSLGEDRYIVMARVLTKTWETIHGDSIANLLDWVKQDSNRIKGEIVLVVEGKPQSEDETFSPQAVKLLALLTKELPLKKAAAIVAETFGYKKNALYQYGLEHLDS